MAAAATLEAGHTPGAAPPPPLGHALWLWLADTRVGLGRRGFTCRRRQPPPTRRRTLACGGVSTGCPVLLTAGVAVAAASLLTLRGAGGATGGEAAVIELSAAAGDTSMPRTALRTLAAVEAGGGPGGPHLSFPPLLPSPPRRLVALRPQGAHLNAAAPLTSALLGVVAAALADSSEAGASSLAAAAAVHRRRGPGGCGDRGRGGGYGSYARRHGRAFG